MDAVLRSLTLSKLQCLKDEFSNYDDDGLSLEEFVGAMDRWCLPDDACEEHRVDFRYAFFSSALLPPAAAKAAPLTTVPGRVWVWCVWGVGGLVCGEVWLNAALLDVAYLLLLLVCTHAKRRRRLSPKPTHC